MLRPTRLTLVGAWGRMLGRSFDREGEQLGVFGFASDSEVSPG